MDERQTKRFKQEIAEDVLDELVCSITGEVFIDPVVVADGHTYERSAIEQWFKTSNKSPLTGSTLANKTLIPNYMLKKTLHKLEGYNSNVIILPDGAKYTGHVNDAGEPHGKGVKTHTGYKYEGNFKNGVMDGDGIYLTASSNGLPVGTSINNVRYVGHFANDHFNGYGNLSIIEIKYNYKGEFKDGKQEGNGMETIHPSGKYEGEFKNGLRDGFGKYTNGWQRYEGCWKEGKKEGNGILFDDNKISYEGSWKNDLRDGYGESYERMIHTTTKYKGEWKNDKYNGQGEFSSQLYTQKGEFKDGYIIKGSITYTTGIVMEGTWTNKILGVGKKIYTNGEVYNGAFSGYERHGYGKMKYKDGSVYKGHWEDDKKSGYGELIKKDGTSYKAFWNNNRMAIIYKN